MSWVLEFETNGVEDWTVRFEENAKTGRIVWRLRPLKWRPNVAY